MKYLLAEKAEESISYTKQNTNTDSDSHFYILNEIKNRIKNTDEARRIRDKILNLKRYRIEADYRDKRFTQEEALDCITQADAIIRNLTSLISV